MADRNTATVPAGCVFDIAGEFSSVNFAFAYVFEHATLEKTGRSELQLFNFVGPFQTIRRVLASMDTDIYF